MLLLQAVSLVSFLLSLQNKETMTGTDQDREKSLQEYRKKLLEHKEVESRLKESK